MLTKKIAFYEEKVGELKQAQRWIDLRKSVDSQSGRHFAISPAHCYVKLTICGQHSAGENNYHESPKSLNEAILSVIMEEMSTILMRAEGKLEEKVKVAREGALTEIESIKKQMAEQH